MNCLAGVTVFLAGWLVGVFTGTRITHHRLTQEVTVQIHQMSRWLDRVNAALARRLALIVVLILLVAGYSIIHGQRQGARDQAAIRAQAATAKVQADCVTQYANRLYESLAPRQRAAKRLQAADTAYKSADAVVNAALLQLLRDALVTHPNPNRNKQDAVVLKGALAAKQRAATRANDLADQLNEERVRKPYPPPPKEVCPK